MVFETDHTMGEGMKKSKKLASILVNDFSGGHFDLLKDVEPEMSSCKVHATIPTYNRIIFPVGTPFSLF